MEENNLTSATFTANAVDSVGIPAFQTGRGFCQTQHLGAPFPSTHHQFSCPASTGWYRHHQGRGGTCDLAGVCEKELKPYPVSLAWSPRSLLGGLVTSQQWLFSRSQQPDTPQITLAFGAWDLATYLNFFLFICAETQAASVA